MRASFAFLIKRSSSVPTWFLRRRLSIVRSCSKRITESFGKLKVSAGSER